MLSYRTINIILILFGVSLAIWGQTFEPRNQYLLIAGIMVIMFAIYRVSSRLPSRAKKTEEKKDFVIDESFDENELDELSVDKSKEENK